jgi:hypothetical protein
VARVAVRVVGRADHRVVEDLAVDPGVRRVVVGPVEVQVEAPPVEDREVGRAEVPPVAGQVPVRPDRAVEPEARLVVEVLLRRRVPMVAARQ